MRRIQAAHAPARQRSVSPCGSFRPLTPRTDGLERSGKTFGSFAPPGRVLFGFCKCRLCFAPLLLSTGSHDFEHARQPCGHGACHVRSRVIESAADHARRCGRLQSAARAIGSLRLVDSSVRLRALKAPVRPESAQRLTYDVNARHNAIQRGPLAWEQSHAGCRAKDSRHQRGQGSCKS
jgi:hypothetical protein